MGLVEPLTDALLDEANRLVDAADEDYVIYICQLRQLAVYYAELARRVRTVIPPILAEVREARADGLRLQAEVERLRAACRFPNKWPHPYFLHVAGSDDTTCDLHIEWGFAELYVSKEGKFHLLADDDVDIEGPEALTKLREILDRKAGE